MATLDETRLPALRLDRLHKLRTRDSLPDEDMPLVLRDALIDPSAPNPSVETLLHAFLPHKFVDHTHANAVLSITDQEDSELFCVDVYGSRMGIVPYVMPGFGLAGRAAGIYELKPKIEGLILQKHGIVTFGSSAREVLRAHDRDGFACRGSAGEKSQGCFRPGARCRTVGAARGDRAHSTRRRERQG